MKAKHDKSDEFSMPFKECRAVIMDLNDVKTGYGDKLVATLQTKDSSFNVFVNATSLKNMIEAFGDEDSVWLKQAVELKLEVDKKFKSDMIVLHPVK